MNQPMFFYGRGFSTCFLPPFLKNFKNTVSCLLRRKFNFGSPGIAVVRAFAMGPHFGAGMVLRTIPAPKCVFSHGISQTIKIYLFGF